MNKIALIILFCVSSVVYAQDIVHDSITITKEDILGRWTEVKRSSLDNKEIMLPYKDCYIFKDDLSHKGQITKGIILFDVTGRYAIDKENITIKYFDLLGSKQEDKYKIHLLHLKIISFADTEINAHVTEEGHGIYYIRLHKTKE